MQPSCFPNLFPIPFLDATITQTPPPTWVFLNCCLCISLSVRPTRTLKCLPVLIGKTGDSKLTTGSSKSTTGNSKSTRPYSPQLPFFRIAVPRSTAPRTNARERASETAGVPALPEPDRSRSNGPTCSDVCSRSSENSSTAREPRAAPAPRAAGPPHASRDSADARTGRRR